MFEAISWKITESVTGQKIVVDNVLKINIGITNHLRNKKKPNISKDNLQHFVVHLSETTIS